MKATWVVIVCSALGALAYLHVKLPVKYLLCDGSGEDCNLVARFDDMDTCERYRERGRWLCDVVSTPGKAKCDIPPASDSRLVIGKCR